MSTDLATALRARGMRVTPQRVWVQRALSELDRHVTADELLEAVADRLPNVALPTIYATLELFEELGIVRRVQRAGTTLFDPRVEPHHHLVCTRCGSIEDLDSELDTSRSSASPPAMASSTSASRPSSRPLRALPGWALAEQPSQRGRDLGGHENDLTPGEPDHAPAELA